jgi:stalled ribosome rescue protein Dom34
MSITIRKVAHETSSGAKSSEKKRIDITIKLEEIDYDQIGEEIRLKGKNVAQSQHINVGQYQTFSIVKHVPFTIYKKFWDDIHLEKLKIASDPTITSDLAAIVSY